MLFSNIMPGKTTSKFFFFQGNKFFLLLIQSRIGIMWNGTRSKNNMRDLKLKSIGIVQYQKRNKVKNKKRQALTFVWF